MTDNVTSISLTRRCLGKQKQQCFQVDEHTATRWECNFHSSNKDEFMQHCKNIYKRVKWRNLIDSTKPDRDGLMHCVYFRFVCLPDWRSKMNSTDRHHVEHHYEKGGNDILPSSQQMNGYKNLVFNGQRIANNNSSSSSSSPINNQVVPIIGNSSTIPAPSLPPIVPSSNVLSNGFPINFINQNPNFPQVAIPPLANMNSMNSMNSMGPPRFNFPFSMIPNNQSNVSKKSTDLSNSSNLNNRLPSTNAITIPVSNVVEPPSKKENNNIPNNNNISNSSSSSSRSFNIINSSSSNNSNNSNNSSTRENKSDNISNSNNSSSGPSIKSIVSKKSISNSSVSNSITAHVSNNNSNHSNHSHSSDSPLSNSPNNSSSIRNQSTSKSISSNSSNISNITNATVTNPLHPPSTSNSDVESTNRSSSLSPKLSLPQQLKSHKSILGKRKSRTSKRTNTRMTINYINEIEDEERDQIDSDGIDSVEVENMSNSTSAIEEETPISKINGNSLTQQSKNISKNRRNSSASPSPNISRRNPRNISPSDPLDDTNNTDQNNSENMRENEEDINMRSGDLQENESGSTSSSKELNKLRKDATLLVDFYQDTISMNSINSPSSMLPPNTPNAPSTPSNSQSSSANQPNNSSNSSESNVSNNSNVNTVNSSNSSNPNIIHPSNFIQYYYSFPNYPIQYSPYYPYLPVPLPDSYKTRELLDIIGKKLELPEDMLEAAATKLLNQGFIIIAGLRNLTNWEKLNLPLAIESELKNHIHAKGCPPNSINFPQNTTNVIPSSTNNNQSSTSSVSNNTSNNSTVTVSQSNVNYSTPPSTPYQAIPTPPTGNTNGTKSNVPWNIPLTPFSFGSSQLFVPSTPTFTSNGYWTGTATPNETEYDQYGGESVLSGVSTNSNQENTNNNQANDSDENIPLDNSTQGNDPNSDQSEGEISYNLDEEVALEREKEETEAENFPIQLNNEEEDSYALEDIKPVPRNQRETRRMRANSQTEKSRSDSTDEAATLLQISDLLQTKPRITRRK